MLIHENLVSFSPGTWYQDYRDKTQAKERFTILTLAQFSGKDGHTLH